MKRLNNKLTFIVLFLVVVALLATRFSYAYQFSLTSDEYEIINNTIIVTPITNAVTQSDIKNNINYLGNIEIYDLKDKIINDNDYVGTGFKLKTASNYYDIIVLGDVTGDGKISIGDVAKLYNHFRSGNILNNESLEAGKVNRNSDISIGDVAKLYNFYRGNTSLVYYNKTLKLTNYDNLDISLDNPIPGDSITRTFSVKNSGTSTEEYNIFLSEIINSFNDKTDLVYTLDSDNGCASSERVVPSISGDESKIISSCNIPKNTTHTYTLKLSFKKNVLPQDDNANVSFSAKISLNDFEKANIDTNAYLAETVEDLKTKNIEVGKHVITKGYYSPLDGGNAYYVIEAKDKQKIDNGRYIELDNGNIAKLIPENNTINVKQYGLVGDGIVEEAAELQSVMKQLKEDDCNTIYIPDGIYNMNHTVLIYSGNIIGGNDTKIRIFGNDEEYFFANDRTNKPSSQKDTINISSLKFEVNREKVEGSRSHVFVIRYLYTDNSSIKNCDFSTLEGNTYGVNPIDLYTTNTNTRIDNINSVLYTIDSGLTTHVCIRERYSNHTTKNVIVSNINGEKNGFDESIWIDAWYGNLEDVEVYDSEFKDKGLAVSSFYIAANYETSALRNIDVHNNIISKDNYSYKILSLGTKQDTNATPGMNENLNFHDNTIIINSNKESGLASGSTIVMVGESANKDANISDIFFENNTIISENALIGDVIRDNVGILNVKNNTIKVNNFSRNTNNFLGIYEGVLSIDNEHLSKTDGSAIEVKNVFRNCLNVKNITANINGDLVNDYLFTKSANYINLNITTSGKVFNITAKSTSTPTYNIENSTFTNSNNAYNAWYSDINSATSTNQQVTFNVTNTSFTNNNKYGSMTINNN